MKFRKKPVVVEAITFDELIAHGRANGANIVNGMPWSWSYNGHPISHERDDCYLIPTLEGTMQMGPNDMLITGVKGEIYPCKRERLRAQGGWPRKCLLLDPAADAPEANAPLAPASLVALVREFQRSRYDGSADDYLSACERLAAWTPTAPVGTPEPQPARDAEGREVLSPLSLTSWPDDAQAPDDTKHARDSQPRYSQYQMDEATKPLHAEIERLRAVDTPPRCPSEATHDDGPFQCEGKAGHTGKHWWGALTWPMDTPPRETRPIEMPEIKRGDMLEHDGYDSPICVSLGAASFQGRGFVRGIIRNGVVLWRRDRDPQE